MHAYMHACILACMRAGMHACMHACTHAACMLGRWCHTGSEPHAAHLLLSPLPPLWALGLVSFRLFVCLACLLLVCLAWLGFASLCFASLRFATLRFASLFSARSVSLLCASPRFASLLCFASFRFASCWGSMDWVVGGNEGEGGWGRKMTAWWECVCTKLGSGN